MEAQQAGPEQEQEQGQEPGPHYEPEPEVDAQPEPQPDPDSETTPQLQLEPEPELELELEPEPEPRTQRNKTKKTSGKKTGKGKRKPSKKASGNHRRASETSLEPGYVARAPKTPVRRRPPAPDTVPLRAGRGSGVDYMAVLAQTGPGAKHRQPAATSPLRSEQQAPAAPQHSGAGGRVQPATGRGQQHSVDYIVEQVKRRVAERQQSRFAEDNRVSHTAAAPIASKHKLGFRAGGGGTTEEEQRRVAARVAARLAPEYARPPVESRRQAQQHISEQNAAAAADLWLKENAIRSTWQFPSPPASAAAKGKGFVVPPSSPPDMRSKQRAAALERGAAKTKQQRGGSGPLDDRRRGNAEQQVGHVNWSSTLRNDVWGDEMTRYIGINPKHSNGEDWRSPRMQAGNPKVHPPDSLVHGTSGSSPTKAGLGAGAPDAGADASAR